MARRCIRNQCLASLKGEDCDFTFRVNTNELVGAELNVFRRGFARQREDDRYAPLTKHVDLTMSKLGITGSDCKEGLNRVVGNSTDLRVDTAASELVD